MFLDKLPAAFDFNTYDIQWMFSLICARINGWVINGEAGALRLQRPHYGVILMDYRIQPSSEMCLSANNGRVMSRSFTQSTLIRIYTWIKGLLWLAAAPFTNMVWL